MKKSIKFLLTTAWILLTRAYDAYATYQYTPDLANEANPLASVLGLSWLPLLTIIGLLLAYVIYAYYVSTFQTFNFLPKEKGYGFIEFTTYVYLGKKTHWTSMLYKVPNSITRFNHYAGNVLTQSLVFAGIVSTIMWLLINYTSWYMQYHRASIIYLILVVGCILIGFRWSWKLYQKDYLPVNNEA